MSIRFLKKMVIDTGTKPPGRKQRVCQQFDSHLCSRAVESTHAISGHEAQAVWTKPQTAKSGRLRFGLRKFRPHRDILHSTVCVVPRVGIQDVECTASKLTAQPPFSGRRPLGAPWRAEYERCEPSSSETVDLGGGGADLKYQSVSTGQRDGR